jgi:L-aminopeptidase/D-esterase-like protein
MNTSSRCGMESIDTLPPEKIAFIAYNIGVYESVQKFGSLITSGKIANGTDVSRVAELLSESLAFYDAEMISELMNAMLQHTNNNAINRVTAGEVRNIMNQLRAVGVSIP